MTILTWCEDCSEDMDKWGGRSRQYCNEEYCYGCIENHEKYCNKNPKNIKTNDDLS